MTRLANAEGAVNGQAQRDAYRNLSPHQVVMIDQALGMVGDFGEVRLVVQKGALRFIVTQTSHDTLKWVFEDSDRANEVRTS